MKTTLRFPSGSLTFRSGTEGPRHDPYAWGEVEVTRHGHVVCSHMGLDQWLEVDGERQTHLGNAFLDDDQVEYLFRVSTGHTPREWDRFARRARSRCHQCGCRTSSCVDGMPGETLDICDRCENIVGCSFYESAII